MAATGSLSNERLCREFRISTLSTSMHLIIKLSGSSLNGRLGVAA